MKTYHIYLLRHGMTQGNKEGRYVGRLDLPLSPDGKRQILEMKKEYTYPSAEMFFSSPKARCLQTLELLYPGETPHVVEGITECDFGDYEGKSLSELKDDPEYQKFASGVVDSAPNGESSKSFQLRTIAAFEQIVDTLMRSDSSTAVIMGHGGTIMSVLGAYGFPRRAMYEWTSANGTGYETLITPLLWMSSKAIEVVGGVPYKEPDNNDDHDYKNDVYE